jgi:hypothetical protein
MVAMPSPDHRGLLAAGDAVSNISDPGHIEPARMNDAMRPLQLRV